MSTATSTVPQLPIEVMERIIDLVGELFYEHTDVYRQDLYTMWKACALTCRAMTPRSQFWLFRSIIVCSHSQADSLSQLLRKNPKVGEYSRSLTIAGPSDGGSGKPGTWISWIPILLAPRMTHLQELWLEGDVFSGSHPIFPMAVTAFKSIRRLELNGTKFSTFGHCFRFIRAFPRLDYLGVQYLSLASKRPTSPKPQLHSKSRSRNLQIAHFDLWSDHTDGSDFDQLVEWLAAVQDHRVLQTLSFEIGNNDLVPNVLRCGPHVRSVYLILRSDSAIVGFENLSHLQMLHLQIEDSTFPLQSITSIILSTPSQRLQNLVIYVATDEEDKGEWGNADDPAKYEELDNALRTPKLREVELTLCLFGADSARAVVRWEQKLRTLLPKFWATARFKVESTKTEYPYTRWMEDRDRLWIQDGAAG